MRDRKERDAVKIDRANARIRVEDDVEEEVPAFVRGQPDRRSRKEDAGCSNAIHTRVGSFLPSLRPSRRARKRNYKKARQ